MSSVDTHTTSTTTTASTTVTTTTAPIDDQAIADYLQANPDFFSRHPRLLETLRIPHESGSAISLVEKQLAVLREQNGHLRSQLKQLMEVSATNDSLFDKSRSLVLELVAATSATAIASALHRALQDDFKIPLARLVLLDKPLQAPGVTQLTRAFAEDKLDGILNAEGATCGVLRSQQLLAMFGDDAKYVGSVAVMPLKTSKGDDHPYGVLALGSKDSHYYHNDMDTLFLRFIADTLNLLLPARLATPFP